MNKEFSSNGTNEVKAGNASAGFNRTAYLDDNGDYVYVEDVNIGTAERPNWIRKEVTRIKAGDYPEIIEALKECDKEEALQERYDRNHSDYGFLNAQRQLTRNDEECSDTAPIENICDPHGDILDILLSDGEEEGNPKVQALMLVMKEKLTEEQRGMIYDHLGSWMYLEEIREREIEETGRMITQQAISKRWNRIMQIVCAEFDVPVPKTRGKNKNE